MVFDIGSLGTRFAQDKDYLNIFQIELLYPLVNNAITLDSIKGKFLFGLTVPPF